MSGCDDISDLGTWSVSSTEVDHGVEFLLDGNVIEL